MSDGIVNTSKTILVLQLVRTTLKRDKGKMIDFRTRQKTNFRSLFFSVVGTKPSEQFHVGSLFIFILLYSLMSFFEIINKRKKIISGFISKIN